MMHIWPYIPKVKECDRAYQQILEAIKKEKE